jgi:membrane-associated protease RseP (regulator of RpoE activity)
VFIAYALCFFVAILIHELGHLAAARACEVTVTEFGMGWGPELLTFRLARVSYRLHALPVGAYVRLDMDQLQRRPLSQQATVLLAGIIVNLVAAALTTGTFFSTMNFLLAATNILPLYQQDGWKCGIVMLRAMMRGKNSLVEWTFTIAGGFLSLSLFVGQTLRHL